MKKSKQDYKMLWALILLILFAGIIVSASLLSHSENKSSFSVNIVSPTGGEAWQGNTANTISYTISGGVPNYTVENYTVELFYTADSQTFTPIHTITNQTEGEHTYTWTTPNITSNTVQVRVNITDSSSTTTSNLSETFEIDSTEPSAVSDLSAQASSYNAITLTWTAPGEDGTLYKVTNTTDEDNMSIPDNIPAGITSNLTLSDNIMIDSIRVYLRINHTYVANLIVKLSHPDNTTATLFNRSGGSDDNIWGWYEGNSFTPDPSGSVNLKPVDDLSVFKDKGSKGVWKLWVSDNSGGEIGAIDYWKIEVKTGKVATYELRYNTTSEVTEENWENSTLYPTPVPGIPGSVENFHIVDLLPGVKYYFALKSIDNVGWESDVSNSANGTTLLNVEVLSPNRNEVWSGESEQIIKYRFSGSKPDAHLVYDVLIWYIHDDTIVNIPTPVSYHDNPGTYECNWTTPKINSTNVKIRVNITVAGHSYGEDESDTNFTIDSASPKVISTAPANNGYVLFDENIVITFNESMNTASVESAFSIAPSVANLTWAWNTNSTIATIYHDNFTENHYSCKINTTAKDLSEPGNSLLEDYIFNFTAVEPLSVRVIYPNGNETWDGTKNQVIAYEISGGAPPYNITLYWVNATDGVTGLIGYDTNSSAGEHSWTWVAPSITNNTLKIKISIVDNTTPFQAAYDLTDWFFEIDSTAPGKPDLEEPAPNSIAVEGYPRAHAVKLNWIALGDDGAIGKASYYDIRCYDSYITEENWDDIPSYWQFTYNTVASTGEFDSYVINDLEPDTMYYFRLKAYDNVGFASDLSDCVSIKTLKFETWSDTMEGVPGFEWINKTMYITSSKTVSYTEVLMKGNLRVVNNVELKFEKVLFIMDCSEDWEYSIQVAPGGLTGFSEGGKFELQYSNISASVSTMPDGSERWHPYLFTAYRNSIFWMFYSSMHHCGGRPEDIENIELDFAQTDVEIDVELGIEIRSSDVSIENSIISQNWGIFIRTSLPMAASPTIKYNTIEHNRYGIVIKPKIDIAEQWPINLVVNNITDNGVGVYSDSARVGLEGCQFIRNTYGVIYNNTPLDWPNNVSGVIYHCVFDGNKYDAVKSFNSSLKLVGTSVTNNTYLNWYGKNIQNELHSTIYFSDSDIEITGNSEISGNTCLYLENSTMSNVTIASIYSTNSKVEISNSTFSGNTGYYLQNSSMDNITTSVIYFANIIPKSLNITNTIISDNTAINQLSTTIDYNTCSFMTIYTESAFLTISASYIANNYDGILSVITTVEIENSTLTGITGDEYSGGLAVLCLGCPLNVTSSNITSNFLGIICFLSSPIIIVDSTISDNVFGIYVGGTPTSPEEVTTEFFEFSTTISLPGLSGMLERISNILNRTNITQFTPSLVITNNSITGNFVSLLVFDLSMNSVDNVISGSYVAIYGEVVSITMVRTSVSSNIDYGIDALVWESEITITDSTWSNSFFGLFLHKSSAEIVNTSILTTAICVYAEEKSSLTIVNTNISGEIEERFNIGIFLVDSSADIFNLTVSGKKYGTYYHGGIYSSSSFLNITESKFFDNSKGIVDMSSTIMLDYNEFWDNGVVVWCVGSDITAVENNFINNDVSFKLEGGSTGELAYNIISGRSTAIKCSYSSPSILNNTITSGTTGNGIDVTGASPVIQGNIISNTLRGITCSSYSSPNITDNEIKNSRLSGISVGLWCSPYIVHNRLKNVSKGIECGFYSSPFIIDNRIDINEYGIYGDQTSATINDNSIKNNKYGVWCKKSLLYLINNTIENNEYGMYVQSSEVTINHPLISNNSYGAYFEKSSLSISNTTIVNNNIANDSYGIYLYKCSDPALPRIPVKIISSRIINNILDLNSLDSIIECRNITINTIYLHASSSLECIGFIPDFNNITFADNLSKVEVSFYLTVFVKWQNNEPVDNGSVTIYNVNDVPTNFSTDSNGTVYTKILVSKVNKTSYAEFMPHRVNASKYDISNETGEIWVNKTHYQHIELVLYDNRPPLISIDPVFFNPTNNKFLTLTGTAKDNIELIKWVVENETGRIQVKVNDGNWVNLTDYTFEVVNSTLGNYTVKWSGVVTLNEGDNTVYVRVKDFAGNNGTNTVTDTLGNEKITLDTTPPALVITSSVPETTNQPTLTITGETDPDATLTINTVSVELDENGNFSKTFNLDEGVNVFTVAASDSLGNENRKVLSIIVFDNTPPTSGITYIKNPINTLTSITGIANDDISGIKKVEISIIKGSDGYYWTGSAWSSAETWLTASGTSTWTYPWTPETDGVYTIMSKATDNAENVESASDGITFTYDKTPPTLTNIKPSNDTETESGTITVSGETDGVNVTVNGKYADVKDGKFSATVKLGTGKNTITIIAKDLAGNTNEATIIVKRTPGWVPPPVGWIALSAGVIIAALMIAVFVLYKKKIIKLKLPKEKAETGKAGKMFCIRKKGE